MAKLTRKMEQELDSMLSGANQGLRYDLRDYLNIAIPAFRAHASYYRLSLTRRQLQAHIDTLSDLITTKVHHP